MSRPPPAAALTTIWTPPCGISAFIFSHILTTTDSTSICKPPNWGSYWSGNAGYYSPAICPSGFFAATTRFDPLQGPPVLSGETAWICIPRGFSVVSAWPSFATAGPGSPSTAQVIQIRWQSSDLSILETHPLTPGLRFGSTTSGPPPTSNTSPSGTISPTGSTDVDGSGGISTGAKAGIGAAIGAVALLCLIAVIIFIRRHRSNRLHQPAEIQIEVGGTDTSGTGIKPAEKANVAYSPIHEIDSSPRQNLQPTELPTAPPGDPPAWHDLAINPPVQYDKPAYSELPQGDSSTAVPPTAAELEALRARRETLDVQRLRILQLQQIEEERAQLDQQISHLERRGLR